MRNGLLLSSGLAVLVAACGAEAPEMESGTSESALRALTATEIVGSIAPGQTKTGIAYDDSSTYRALSFQVGVGDEVTIEVRASGADAKAWLLGANFQTLASNDDASSTTRDSRIKRKLVVGGTHYVAFREKNYEDASFEVSLSVTPLAPAPPPSQPPGSSNGCTSSSGFRFYCRGPFQYRGGEGYSIMGVNPLSGTESCYRGCADGWDYNNDPPMQLAGCEASIQSYWCR